MINVLTYTTPLHRKLTSDKWDGTSTNRRGFVKPGWRKPNKIHPLGRHPLNIITEEIYD